MHPPPRRTCGEESVTSLGQAEEMLDARRLHTHFGQDGGIFNGDTPKFCALSILRNLLLRPLTSRA